MQLTSIGACSLISGEFTRSPKLSNADTTCSADVEDHPIVTIETTDNFRLTADLTSLHICLKKTPELSESSESVKFPVPCDLLTFSFCEQPSPQEQVC